MTQKKWGHPLRWLVIRDGNCISLQSIYQYLTSSLDLHRATYCNNSPTWRKQGEVTMITKSVKGKQPGKVKFWRMWPQEIFTLSRAPMNYIFADQANLIIFSNWQADNHRHTFRLSDSKINLEFPSGQPVVSSPDSVYRQVSNIRRTLVGN